MKEFVIEVPEKQSLFFKELIQNLGFNISDEISNFNFDISEENIKLVRDRIATVKPCGTLDWDDARKRIKVD